MMLRRGASLFQPLPKTMVWRLLSTTVDAPQDQVEDALAHLESFSERLRKMNAVTQSGVFKEVLVSSF